MLHPCSHRYYLCHIVDENCLRGTPTITGKQHYCLLKYFCIDVDQWIHYKIEINGCNFVVINILLDDVLFIYVITK